MGPVGICICPFLFSIFVMSITSIGAGDRKPLIIEYVDMGQIRGATNWIKYGDCFKGSAGFRVNIRLLKVAKTQGL